MTKSIFGGKGLIPSQDGRLSVRKLREDIQGTNLEAGTNAEVMEKTLIACSTCPSQNTFLEHPGLLAKRQYYPQ